MVNCYHVNLDFIQLKEMCLVFFGMTVSWMTKNLDQQYWDQFYGAFLSLV